MVMSCTWMKWLYSHISSLKMQRRMNGGVLFTIDSYTKWQEWESFLQMTKSQLCINELHNVKLPELSCFLLQLMLKNVMIYFLRMKRIFKIVIKEWFLMMRIQDTADVAQTETWSLQILTLKAFLDFQFSPVILELKWLGKYALFGLHQRNCLTFHIADPNSSVKKKFLLMQMKPLITQWRWYKWQMTNT